MCRKITKTKETMLRILSNSILTAVLTIVALTVGQSNVWAQATSEVGVQFSYYQNQTMYNYSITPLNLGGQAVNTEYQSNNYVRFDDQYTIGDDNIPLTMKLNGQVSFTNAGNFTVDNGGSLFSITFTSTTKYIMGARVTTNNNVTVANCTVTGTGTKVVTVKIPDQSVFSKVILTVANHTPFGIDNSVTISGIDAVYLDDGVNEPVPTVTYKEFSGSTPVTLTAGTEYTVSYINNHYLGTATLTVTGAGNYCGSVSKDYTIRSYDLSDFKKLGDNIYEIATKDDLDHLAIYVNRDNDCHDVTFKQAADIAYTYQYAWDNVHPVDGNAFINTENNYTAIGGYGKPFKGTYDGQGHSISGIRIKKIYQTDGDNAGSQGFIGFLGKGGIVKNVLVKDALIDAYDNIGGIVGYNEGSIIDCIAYHACFLPTSSCGPITGYDGGTVTRSHYRDCRQRWDIFYNDVFALTLGTNVTASKTSGESVTIDGVTYYTQGSTVTIGYSGTMPAGSTVIYTVTATSSGRDVTGEVLSGTTLTIPGYDVTLSGGAYKNDYITHWQASPAHDGSSEEKAYIITTPAGLQLLASEAKSNNGFSGTWFKLNNNIDMSGVTNFEPVVFKGHLYGGGSSRTKTISHLTINSTSTQVGLFGVIDGGSVSYLTLSEASISGQDYVGGIAGQILSGGTIQQCDVVGSTITVKESNLPCAGAIVGFNNGGTLTYNTYHSTLVYAPNIQGTYYKAGGTAFNIGVGYDKETPSNPYGDVSGAELDATKLFLADNRNNADLIVAYADPASHTAGNGTPPSFSGEGIYVTLQGRTLYQDGYWNTLCLPFDVSTTSEPLSGDNVVAMTLNTSTSNLSGNTLTLNFVAAPATIPAGTPFLIKWTGGGIYVNPTFYHVKISSTPPTEVEFTGGKFVGTYSPVPFTANDKSILFLGAENKLYWPSTAMQIGSCRAYFQLNDPTQVKEFKLCFEDEDSADGIGKIQNSKFKIQNEANAWYDLSGRRLDGKPTQKGLYIVNGKKILK